jgi:hypothetical protein
MNCDGHEFATFSTCLGTKEVMVQCVNCGAFGVIKKPTRQEWTDASQRVRVNNERVTVKQASTTPYIERKQ